MKFKKAIWYVSNYIEKWLWIQSFSFEWNRYISNWNTIYSSKLIDNDLVFDIVEMYDNQKNPLDKKDFAESKALISSIKNWEEIKLDDINVFNATNFIANIKDSNFWIHIDTLNKILKEISGKNYRIFVSEWWLIAFVYYDFATTKDEQDTFIPLIVTGLVPIQTSLIK